MAKTIFITNNNTGQCVQSYYIELKKTADSVFTPLALQYSNPIRVDNLEDDTSYDIRVTIRCCNGANADPHTVTIVTTELGTVAGFNATGGDDSVSLVWDALSGATRYEVQRALNGDYSDAVIAYDGTGTSFNNTGLASTTTYYFRVRGYNTTHLAGDFATDSATTT